MLGLVLIGSSLVCFEHSTLPEHSHKPTLVLRVLKIIDPVECIIPGYDGHVPKPVEGSLVYRHGKHGLKVWSWNTGDVLDRTKHLRLLLESH